MNYRLEENLIKIMKNANTLLEKLIVLVEKKIDGQDR